MSPYEEQRAYADALDDDCTAVYGTEYKNWPREDFQNYAVLAMIALDAMTDEEMERRFCAEPDPHVARHESFNYWAKIVTALEH